MYTNNTKSPNLSQQIFNKSLKEVLRTSTMLRLKPKLLDDDPFGLNQYTKEEHDLFDQREKIYQLEDQLRPLNIELSKLEYAESIPELLSLISNEEAKFINSIYKHDENGFIKEKDRVVGSLFVEKKYFKKQDRDLKSETKRTYANKCSNRLKSVGLIKVIGAKPKRIYRENGLGRYKGIRTWTRPNVGDKYNELVTYDLIQPTKVTSIPKEVELKILESSDPRLSPSVHAIRKRHNYLTGRIGLEKKKVVNLLMGLGIDGSINKLMRFSFDVIVKAVSTITKIQTPITNPVNYLETICCKIIGVKHKNPAT